MRDVFLLEPTTQILPSDPYVASYPHLLDYFASRASIEPGDVVRGAHMVYGWMPTILELNLDHGANDLVSAAALLTKAKKGGLVGASELETLATLINNSLVGASKVLHFVAPTTFAIWDSNVYSFIHEKPAHHYRVNNVATYLEYLRRLQELATNPKFAAFHASVERKLGYQASPLRALEMVMFLNAPRYRG